MVLGACFISLLAVVMLGLVVRTAQINYAQQIVQRSFDAAAVSGATAINAAMLLQNTPALDKPVAEARARSVASANLAAAQPFLEVTAAALAGYPVMVPGTSMAVVVANTGEADPWTGAPVTRPTVFINATYRLTGVPSAAVGGPAGVSADPLLNPTATVRAKAGLRLRS